MSAETRRASDEKMLRVQEAEFHRLLREALESCSRGFWGLFGCYDAWVASLSKHVREKYASADAKMLIELGDDIEQLRASLGMPNFALYQRYLEYRHLRGGNVPGEPKLARQFLDELASFDDRGSGAVSDGDHSG